MVLRGQIQGFVYKGFPEIRLRQRQCNFEPRTSEPVLVGIVHIEHEVERAATHAHAGDIDALQRDLRVFERQGVPQGGTTRERDDERGGPCGPYHSP